jgi:hypothetical protein
MVTRNFHELHQSSAGPAASACWQLMPGRAISLRPREAGLLRIAHGQVWATVNGPRAGHGKAVGDQFLQAGQSLPVGAGQRLVFEPRGGANEAPVYFEWTPDPAAVAVRASRWQVAVVQPLRDLGFALLLAGRALGQLLMGLAGYGDYLAAGRGRVLPELETNQP